MKARSLSPSDPMVVSGVDDTVIVLVDNLEKASTSPDFDPDATYIYLRNAIEKEVQNGQMDLQN